MLTVLSGNEYMKMDKDGNLSRPAIGMNASGQWRITGAVEYNNFGRVVRRYSLASIVTDAASIPWHYKNGKQRVHLCDLDHGTPRTWMSPTHCVFPR